jgi:hypothetical protein
MTPFSCPGASMTNTSRHAPIQYNRRQKVRSPGDPEWSQSNPAKRCRCVGVLRGKRHYDDPRCSLECRRNWGWKEWLLLTIHLRRLPDHFRLYAGTLNVFGPVGLADHMAIREAFREGIGERFGPAVQFQAVAEAGRDDGRLHYHHTMWSDGPEVDAAEVRAIFRGACDGRQINVDHGEMRSMAAARYMFKPGRWHYAPGSSKPVKLLARGTGRITWGTRGFFPKPVKEAIWAELIAGWYGNVGSGGEAARTIGGSGTAVPGNLRIT